MELKIQHLKKLFIFSTIIYYFSPNYTSATPIAVATNLAQDGYEIIMKTIKFHYGVDVPRWRKEVMIPLSINLENTQEVGAHLLGKTDTTIEELSNKIDMQEVNKFIQIIHNINDEYTNEFMEYFSEKAYKRFRHETLRNFMNDKINEAEFRRNLRSLGEFIIPRTYLLGIPHKRIFDYLLDFQKLQIAHQEDCNAASSHHQQLFAVYNAVIYTLVRGYCMIIHGYKFLLHDSVSWDAEKTLLLYEYRLLVLGIVPVVQQAMNKASYEIRRCDPDNLVEDANFKQGKPRTFSLREHYTDFGSKRVITGVRIKVTDDIIDFEIQEGQLLNGSIDPSTVRWNLDANYYPETGPKTFQWNYDTRSLNLDNIILPAGYAVSGVRFASINGVLSLVVAGVEIFNETGYAVAPRRMDWYWPANSTRTELRLNNSDILTIKNASENLAPYINTQEVISDPPAPLGGIGLFSKNYENKGGFVALKLFSTNYSIHLDVDKIDSIMDQYDKYNKFW